MKLFGNLSGAALILEECQTLRPVFREPRFPGQGAPVRIRAQNPVPSCRPDEQAVSFKAFSGYFTLPAQQVAQLYRCSCVVQPAIPNFACERCEGPALNKGELQ
jgi:hypothetical protein